MLLRINSWTNMRTLSLGITLTWYIASTVQNRHEAVVPEGYSTKFYTAGLPTEQPRPQGTFPKAREKRPGEEVAHRGQPLSQSIYHFWKKRHSFRVPSIDKWYPFLILSLEPCIDPCIPFNCCKCTVFKYEYITNQRVFSTFTLP